MAYSIGEFARLSGITATTLRAWQRRYGLLKPERTEVVIAFTAKKMFNRR
jgi:DNA-binding transcriptional MerR regulator